jgi:transposase InsO family protein
MTTQVRPALDSLLGQPRGTQRYAPSPRDDEAPLTARVAELAGAYGRYGYRRVTALLRREAWNVNHKRVRPTPPAIGFQARTTAAIQGYLDARRVFDVM